MPDFSLEVRGRRHISLIDYTFDDRSFFSCTVQDGRASRLSCDTFCIGGHRDITPKYSLDHLTSACKCNLQPCI